MNYQWFRLWNAVLNEEKINDLSGDDFKTWIRLLAVANQGTPRGTLPRLKSVAYQLRCSEPEAEAMIAQMVKLDLFECDSEGAVSAHNWAKWQPTSDFASTERVRAWRERNVSGNVSGNVSKGVSETVSETDQSTETEEDPLTYKNTSSEVNLISQGTEAKRSMKRSMKRSNPVSVEPSENGVCPPYPDPDKSFVTIHPGPNEMPDEVARDIWRRIFARWHDKTLCAEWYQHQRWYTAEVWTAAFTRVEKKYPAQKIGIRLVETIAAEIAVNGQPVDKPPAALPVRPKSRAQELREATAARLAELKAKPGYQTMAEMIEEEEREKANKESGKQ